jgi:hypothetical protein
MKLQINIYDRDLVWKGMLDSVVHLVHRSSWHEIVNSELKVSRNAANIEELQPGRILVVNNQREKALIVEEINTTLDDQHWNVTCIPLKAMLNYRIVHPTDFAGLTARTQSAVMMIIPYSSLVSQTRDPDRKFWNTAETFNMFGVVGIKEYGDVIDFKADWNTGLMGDCIVNIAKMNKTEGSYPIGWNIYIPSAFNAYHMDTYQAVDKSILQNINPPVIFSEDFGNLKNASYTYSIKDWRNVVYVQWNNGTADQNTPLGNRTYGETVSFLRKEMVFNSSKKTSAEIQAEGYAELNKRPHVESFTAEIIHNPNTISTYGVDWFLGDVVTVQSSDLMVSINAQITQVDETYENGEYTLAATFGEAKLNFVQLVKNSIK